MITQEQAKKFLKAHLFTSEFKKVRADRAAKLPAPQRRLALLLLNQIAAYHQIEDNYTKTQERREALRKEVEQLLFVENAWTEHYPDVLPIIFGEYAPHVLAGWHLQTKLMYQTGYLRRSFRAPNRPDLFKGKQVEWLVNLVKQFKYDFDLATYARYREYCHDYPEPDWEYLFAGAMQVNDETGKAVFNAQLDTVYDRDDVARVSRTVIKSLLIHDHPDGWEAVIKLLLAAQRQEGLRQTVLECLDETHLSAQMQLMEVILEHKLLRFSSVVRALDVWQGMNWEAAKPATLKRILELGLQYLRAPETAEKGIKSKDNLEVYVALWAVGCHDVFQTFPLVQQLLETGKPAKQMTTLYFLAQTAVYDQQIELARSFLHSENQDIVAYTLINFHFVDKQHSELFSDFLQVWQRLPEKKYESKGKVFNWFDLTLSQEQTMRLAISVANEEQALQLLPLFDQMALSNRESLTNWLLDEKTFKDTPATRQFALKAFADRGEWVRRNALDAVKKMKLQAAEIEQVEGLLTRKSADLRRGIIELLLNLKETEILASAQRLLQAKSQPQRLAGLDILLRLKKEKRATNQVQQLAATFRERPKIAAKEQVLVEQLVEQEQRYTAANGYGLYDPQQLTKVKDPVNKISADQLEKWFPNLYKKEVTDNIYSIDIQPLNKSLISLNNHIQQHKDYEYEVTNGDGSKEKILLGNGIQQTRYYSYEENEKLSPEEWFRLLPLADTWLAWLNETGFTTHELALLDFALDANNDYSLRDLPEAVKKLRSTIVPQIKLPDDEWKTENNLELIITRLSHWKRPADFILFCLDLNESFYASIPADLLNLKYGDYRIKETWRDHSYLHYWVKQLNLQKMSVEPTQLFRLWSLREWAYRTAPDQKDNYKASLRIYLTAIQSSDNSKNDFINTHDFIEKLLVSEDALRSLTNPKTLKNWQKDPTLPIAQQLLTPVVNRILEIETQRGDSPTPFSKIAIVIQRAEGVTNLGRILKAMSKEKLYRGYYYSYSGEPNKKVSLSHLLKVTHPAAEDSQAAFDAMVKELKLSDERLIEVAMYSPQWLKFVQANLGWKGLTEGVWWLHAHTKESGYAVEEKWVTEMSLYTPLQAQDLVDGAVDVDWFQSAYRQLKKSRWMMLYEAAKYVSDGAGHRRAQIFADAMMGGLKLREATKVVKEKRRQDYVRALGLIPLSKRNAESDLLKRYQLLQQFLKESRQFGAQKQASEKLSVRIGMDNLARTAGYSDPIRLTWAMEAKTAQQIMEQAKPVTSGEVTVGLNIDELGKAHLWIKKGDKELKSIPAKLRKDKAILQLKTFQKTLRDQHKRTRKALEEAMCRGDVFTATEITDLFKHPVVAPMLRELVLVVDGSDGKRLGYFRNGGLELPNGERVELQSEVRQTGMSVLQVRVAHCTDLHASGYWSDLQRDCFEQKRIQPFKQIFRELYLPTADELAVGNISRRYDGHQVQPQKTVALLKTRGWTADYDEGLRKVYHRENLVVRLYAMADWFTPADVEAPTLETVSFSRRDSYQNLPFTDISPLIFSEVMRDVDLVVSVAHAGGVDPEASHSTIEMRRVMVEETSRLLGFSNLTLKDRHVLIKGELGDYSIHLGSGTVHKMPGGYLSILPVHSQHRGRLFLPFADDDPKTAEVLSKVLLLAEDGKIKDPTVLGQI
ncbi:MAG: DUF5724 domain-containing protein [Saprospiraceae bacterium]